MAPTALIIGSSQRLDEIDPAACAAAGVSIHRRRSGGGAVLSESMLMLDLAIPRDHRLYLDDVTESYRWIGAVWVAALAGLGIDARALAVEEARADTQALDTLLRRVCFGGRSPYETLVGQRKLVGLAQIRRRAGALYQVGLYMRWRPARTAVLMASAAPERAALAQQLAARVAGISQLGKGQTLDVADVIAAFEAALTQLAHLTPVDDDWAEAEHAARLAEIGRYVAITI
jgi:lipoate-protein ligase A